MIYHLPPLACPEPHHEEAGSFQPIPSFSYLLFLTFMPNLITTPTHTQTADAMFDAVFERSHQFRIEMPFDQASRFLHRIGQYNEFEAARVLDALERVDALIPRKFFGEGNRNNGERAYTLSLGREGSPVLYLELYEWGWCKGPALSDDAIEAICREMELIGKADEATCDRQIISCNNGRKVTFRFWWD